MWTQTWRKPIYHVRLTILPGGQNQCDGYGWISGEQHIKSDSHLFLDKSNLLTFI